MCLLLFLLSWILALTIYLALRSFLVTHNPSKPSKCPVSVNYHFTRRCNKACGFCFHTASSSHIESLANMKRALTLLKDAGMRKINFAGGEPFLYPAKLGQMVDYCKETLRLESVSIVTNGSQVTERFLARHGCNIDILAVSCDSFNESVNIAIGRGSGTQVTKLYEIRDLCRAYGIKFKINTVVCRLNFKEDMNRFIEELQPFRWKCFQVLLVAGENDSERRLRDARRFLIRDEEFAHFCDVHRGQRALVPESNALMAKSYLILDEYLRFLDRDGREPSPSILEVGVQRALESVYWDEKSFVSRGGMYDWSRDPKPCSDTHRDLDW
ncbi:radical SAM enzyme [Aspergillus indologenus CBS 114.80]|uniref:Radical SAM enzyme n=1 Tax=Aspergillus indologenus CBS 114.80 TaxID=1450541 RepID=A0A2V5IEZ5_9EURO|nr:radical SAM enzyme [Aspergillus indologenus CBS 114.80]